MIGRPPSLAFALVDLVVTLVLIVTLSGLAALFYQQVQKERFAGIVMNELDELVKATVAWELAKKREVRIEDVESAMTRKGTALKPGHRWGTLTFLVEDGRIPEDPIDPWENDYCIVPAQGILFCQGPDKMPFTADDAIRPYRSEAAKGTQIYEKDLRPCKVPPIIASMEPCDTTLKTGKPTIKATYYAGAGCAIDIEKTRLYVDQEEKPGTKSGGQILYVPADPLPDGRHSAVLVVKDTAGNETRRQCTFLIDTSPAIVQLTNPPSGRAISGVITVEGLVLDKALKNWTVNWDYREIGRGESEVGSQDPDTRLHPGTLVRQFNTADTLNPVEDGRHFITLFARDLSGQVVTAQSEVTLDNTPPKVFITKNHPGAKGNPQEITTGIPRIYGVANDNLMVREVRYLFTDLNTGQPAEGMPMDGTTAIPVKWDPADLITQKNWTALYNAPIVEWGTFPSRGTTQQQTVAGYRPLVLLPGQYEMSVKAKDLSGNWSSPVTTLFTVNLFQGGVTGSTFLDGDALIPSRKAPYYEEDRHITGLTANVPANQTWGKVRFLVLEAGKTPIATWEVMIDDNGGTNTFSGDGEFTTTGPNRDWRAVDQLPDTTAAPILTKEYRPNGDNPYETGISNLTRRKGGPRTTGEIAEGVYTIRIKYTSDTGVTRSALTTFFLDNSWPMALKGAAVDEKFIQYLTFNPEQARRDTDFKTLEPDRSVEPVVYPVIEAFSTPTVETGQIEFRGKTRDYPTTGVITRVAWDLGRRIAGQTELKVLQAGTVYQVGGSMKRTNLVTYGYTPLYQSTMAIGSTTPGGLDGEGYQVTVAATDGAGITTAFTRFFTINTAGPTIQYFTIRNGKGNTEIKIPSVVGDMGDPGLPHVVDGQKLDMAFSAVCPRPVRGIRYNIFAQKGSSGAGLPTQIKPILGNTVEAVNQTVFKDDDQKEFASLPTTYQLRIVAENQNKDGPAFTTVVGFRFLTNMAIFAPHYTRDTTREASYRTIATTNVSWIGFDEQRDVADFLFANVASAGEKKIFNFTGYVAGSAQSTKPGDSDSIEGWLSRATSNQTTDVLVVLDGFPQDLWDNNTDDPLQRFIESNSVDRPADKRDGDCIIWVGELPFVWVYNLVGKRLKAGGTSDRTFPYKKFYRLGVAQDPFYILSPDPPAVGAPGDSNQIQEIAPLGNGSAYLADLFRYDPFADFDAFPGSQKPFQRQLRCYPNRGPITGTKWSLDRIFSVNQAQLADAQIPDRKVSCANFQLRHVDSAGIVAHFFCTGPKDGTTADSFNTLNPVIPGERKPIPPMASVIKDYIDKYLLNQGNPAEGSKRIYFNAVSSTELGGQNVGGNARDVVYWPTKSEGYGNVTTISAQTQDSILKAVSASQGALYTSRDQSKFAQDTNWVSAAYSLFLYPPGAINRLEVVNSADIAAASYAANGTSYAFSTRADMLKGPTEPRPLDFYTVFFKYAGQANAGAITTGIGANCGDSMNPRVAAGGEFVVFDSFSIYDDKTGTWPPNFNNLKKTTYRGVYRYSLRGPSGQVYFDGAVSKTRLDRTPDVKADSTRPVVSKDGRFVCWQAKDAFLNPAATSRNPRSQIMLAYCARPGQADPWVVGPITADPLGDSGKADMSSEVVAGGQHPYIVFESQVNYDGMIPAADAAGQEIAPSKLDSSSGALSDPLANPRVETKTSIYLFCGSFIQPILRIATGDADCKNPRISPDGDEVVFESRSQKVTGFFSRVGTAPLPQVLDNGAPTGTPPNRVYRVKIRALKSGNTSPSAIIQRISPPGLDLSVGEDRPAVPMLSN